MYLGEKEMLEFLSRRSESSAGNKEVQIQRDREVQRYRYRELQRCRGRGTEVQRYREVKRYRGTERYRGTKILRGTERYSSAGDREVQVVCAVPGVGRAVQVRPVV